MMMSFLEDDIYNVEKILAKKRTEDGEVRYLVKWEGYGSTENTWEPPENFSGCPHVLDNFEKKLRRKLERRERKKKLDVGAGGGGNSSGDSR